MPQGALQPIIKSTDFEYGGMSSVKQKILFENGCLQYLPVFESQIGTYFDTFGCVSFSFANAIEILLDRMIEMGLISEGHRNWLSNNGYIINNRVRLSNRWLVVRSGTDPNVGNSGGIVAGYARNNGLAPLLYCDWNLSSRETSNNKEAYYDASTITSKADETAAMFAKLFDITYEWVSVDYFEQASKEGVIQVYTKAWYLLPNGKYYNPIPGSSGHAIDFGQYSTISVIDQYDPQIKEMSKFEDFYPLGLKININQKYMVKPTIKNNTFIQLVSAPGGFGLYLDGKIIVDDLAKLEASFIMRNNGDTKGKTMPLVKEQWEMFDKINLKGESIQ